MKEDQKYVGSLTIKKNGKIVLDHHNLVVTNGKNFAASRLVSNTEYPALAAIAVGSGVTAAAVGDVGLQNELGRQVFDSAPGRAGATVSMTSTFGPGVGTGTITEAGLFNASSGGNMFSRSTFSGIPKGALDTITVTWSVTAQ